MILDNLILLEEPSPGLRLYLLNVRGDSRGLFSEIAPAELLVKEKFNVAQVNQSFSMENVIRGLHWQPDTSKIVTVVGPGTIIDVCVHMKTKEVFKFEITDNYCLVIPEWFAHGFSTPYGPVNIVYLMNQPYSPKTERGFNPLDPALAIQWKLSPRLSEAILSDRDKAAPSIIENGWVHS